MNIETINKKINLVFTTRKIVNITKELKDKNFEELYFKALNENDLEALSRIIYSFAEDEAGLKSFKSVEEVYDFIDDYKSESKKTYEEIFEEVAGVINDEGFFKQKMSKKELQEKISNPMAGIDMKEIVKTSAEKAVSKMAENQFQGYKG